MLGSQSVELPTCASMRQGSKCPVQGTEVLHQSPGREESTAILSELHWDLELQPSDRKTGLSSLEMSMSVLWRRRDCCLYLTPGKKPDEGLKLFTTRLASDAAKRVAKLSTGGTSLSTGSASGGLSWPD